VCVCARHRYTELLNGAIRHLGKTGYLERLKAQWWERRGECGRSSSGGDGSGGGAARISRMYGGVYVSAAAADRALPLRHRLHRRLTVSHLVAVLPLAAVVASLRHWHPLNGCCCCCCC